MKLNRNYLRNIKLEVLTAAIVNILVLFLRCVLCRLVHTYWSFGGDLCLFLHWKWQHV